jgi:hypothetical protein
VSGPGAVGGRDVTLHGYHGETGAGVPANGFTRGPVFLAYDRELAEAYAETAVLTVTYASARPLVLDTPAAFVAAWQASGADAVTGPFHPDCTHAFAAWAVALGYDAICIPASAFDGEDGYAEVGGRVGDPQMLLLGPERAVIVERTAC